MSDEHFTVDGTLIEAWASQKSFQPKDGSGDGDGRDFRGHTRKNDTHASTTDPDSRLYRRTNHGESKLAYLGHLLIENRHGLIADAMATQADGTAGREAALLILHAQWERAPNRRRTVGADTASGDTRNKADHGRFGPVPGRPLARWRTRPLDPFKAYAPTALLAGHEIELWVTECPSCEAMLAQETELNNRYTPEWTKEGRRERQRAARGRLGAE